MLARREEAGLDHRVRIEHQHHVPVQRTRIFETRLPRRCATRDLIRAALEDLRAERASDVRRAIAAAVGHHQDLVLRAAVRHDRGQTAMNHLLLIVRWHEDQEADGVAACWVGLSVEPRGDREQPKVARSDQAWEARDDRRRNNETRDVHVPDLSS